jgi:hypothetical protein
MSLVNNGPPATDSEAVSASIKQADAAHKSVFLHMTGYSRGQAGSNFTAARDSRRLDISS